MLAAMDSHPNIEIRVFNPFTLRYMRGLEMLFSFTRINRRMHNKSITADNLVTIVGGRNIGDEYYDINKNVNFSDLDVITFGPVVDDVSTAFDKYWNYKSSIPVAALTAKASTDQLKYLRNALNFFDESMQKSEYVQAVRESTFLQNLTNQNLPFSWGKAYAIYDEPEKANPNIHDYQSYLTSKAKPHLFDTQSELILISPYYIPREQRMTKFKELTVRGVRVRILTNSLASTDVSIVYAGYKPYRIPLLRAGIELYESMPANNVSKQQKKHSFGGSSRASLHTKLYILDRKKIFVGSYNFDPRSLNINTELGILFENKELAEEIAQWWDNHVDSWAYKLNLVEEESMEENDESEYGIEWITTENGKEQRYTVEPHTSFWRRFGVDFMSILPIEDQL